MRGFPKCINSREDVTNLLATFPEKTKAFLQEGVDQAESWLYPTKLAPEQSGIEDATHCVRFDENGERYQMTWGFDPGGSLGRLGMTIAEAEAIIHGDS